MKNILPISIGILFFLLLAVNACTKQDADIEIINHSENMASDMTGDFYFL